MRRWFDLWRNLGPGLIVVWFFAAMPAVAAAHPMGNFAICHHATVSCGNGGVSIHYVIDFAEIPTAQEFRTFDKDRNGSLDVDETQRWLKARAPELVAGVKVSVNGKPVVVKPLDARLAARVGEASLATLYFSVTLDCQVEPTDRLEVVYEDTNFAERTGWSEVVVSAGPGWEIRRTDASQRDHSDRLRNYPADELAAPPGARSATVVFERNPTTAASSTIQATQPATTGPGVGVDTISGADTTSGLGPNTGTGPNAGVRGSAMGSQSDAFTRLVGAVHLTPGVVAVSLLVAAGMGCLHALSPGHGKTVVAAYLVGSRGTPGHAVLLGAVVTLTHVAGVFALGLAVLSAGDLVTERAFPWLAFASGLLILGVGLFQLSRRVSAWYGFGAGADGGEHGTGSGQHSHALPAGKVTVGSLVALGVSGGLVPCPSALVVLLGAVALHRTSYGLVLVVAFSAGLAATLTAIGLLMVYARAWSARRGMEMKWGPRLGIASAAGITVLGLFLAGTALVGGGLLKG